MSFDRCVLPAHQRPFELPELGHPVLDRYLVFVAARCRPNTVLATASDLKAFFAVVVKEPDQVEVADVLAFIHQQRRPRGNGNVVRLSDGEAGLSSRTIQRRLSTAGGWRTSGSGTRWAVSCSRCCSPPPAPAGTSPTWCVGWTTGPRTRSRTCSTPSATRTRSPPGRRTGPALG